MKFVIGIDIGASNIRIGIVDEIATIRFQRQIPTIRDDFDGFMTQVEQLIDIALQQDYDIIGIGIGIPGPVKPQTGYIHVLPNIGIGDFDIKTILETRYPLPVYVTNDANAAAYGEALLGEGKDERVVQYITLSTGIGGGLIIDKKIYTGTHGFAQEIGNMIIDPSAPQPNKSMNKGSFESWCSGKSLVAMAQNIGLYPKHAGEVFTNPDCQTIIIDWITHLSMALANMITLYEPNVFILGGGVMRSSDYFYDRILPEVKKYTFPGIHDQLKIAKAHFGQDSGIIGASMLAFYPYFY